MEYVSCGAGQIYRDGGFSDSAELLEELKNRSCSNVTVIGELFAPFAYVRKMPDQIVATEAFQQSLLTLYQQINIAGSKGAASLVVELADATLFRNVIYLGRGPECQILYETHRPPDRVDSPLLEAGATASEYPVFADALYLFIGSVGSFNYGHWLIDDIARLQGFYSLRERFPGRHLVILLPSYRHVIDAASSDTWDVRRAASVHAFLKDAHNYSVQFADTTEMLHFDKLFYVSPISHHPVMKSPEALALLARNLSHGTRKTGGRPGKKVYVVRRATRGRVLDNEAELRTLLEARGFKSLDTESMSIAQQASTFENAGVVVGTMGAAMVNTLFCKPGARLIYIAPDGWVEPFYWDLAALRNHHYSVCYGPTLPTEGPAHMSSFELPKSSLLQTLQTLSL